MTHFWNLSRNICISIGFTCIFFENVAYIAKVEGVSMQPTLNDDHWDPEHRSGIRGYLNRIHSSDLVLLSHWSTRNYDIRRGDIVSLISPKNPNQLIIKRVIGLEGDKVTARASARYASIEIPKGQCWVEGDNSAKSMDSNAFGPVAKGLITAQAKCIIWPPRRWQMLPPAFPNDRLISAMSGESNVAFFENTTKTLKSNLSGNSTVQAGMSYDSRSLQQQQPLNIELRDHHTRIDNAQLFIQTAQID